MDFITTTELRTKTTELVNALAMGKSINLIHRSKVIGTFKPIQADEAKFDAHEFALLAKASAKAHGNIPKSQKARDEIYRQELTKKYA